MFTRAIRVALEYHEVPPYLRSVIEAYLRDRTVKYFDRGGMDRRREGSVWGPLLWNLAYDAVLCTSVPSGLSVICYADDTLILARGSSFQEVRLDEQGVAYVVSKICELGCEWRLTKLRRYGSMACVSARNHSAHAYGWVTLKSGWAGT